MLAVLSVHEVPASSHDLLLTMVGVLGTSWVGCMGYYFGTSAGSERKTELLAKAPPPLP
jgi:hypothetical protein